MAIRYALFENKMLHASANEYMARTRAVGTADFDMIAARMVEMGTTVTKSDILAVFEDMSNAAESLLLDGFNINFDGLCNMKCSIKGIFAGPTDSFDAARHSLAVNASIGHRIRKAVLSSAEIVKAEAIIPVPSPAEFVDTASAAVNGTITPGNIGTINGYRLKFDPAAVDEGIFLIAAADSEIKAASVATNKPARLVFLVPDMSGFAPEIHLEIRSRMSIPDGRLRIGRLNETLTIA